MSDGPRFFLTVTALASAVNHCSDPGAANSLLCGAIIANLIGHITDEQWQRMRMVAADPCGRPGCNCELIRSEMMDALDTQREDWKANVGEMTELRNSEQ